MIASSSLTRPADTTAYAANDVVGGSSPANHSWTIAANAATGEAYILDARIITNKASIVPRLKLHLYSTAPTALTDNAAHTILWSNRAGYLGSISFGAMTGSGTGTDVSVAEIERNPKHIVLSVSGTAASTQGPGRRDCTIYGVLETLDAFTPDSGQIVTIYLASQAAA